MSPYIPPTSAAAFIDVRNAIFFPYNDQGLLDLPGYPTPAETPYEGIMLRKVKTLTPNLGAPRQIAVVAQGSVQTTFNLPSIDPQTIEASVAYLDLEAYAEMTGVINQTIGGATVAHIGTNKVSFEKKGILIVTALAAHESDDDNDVCVTYFFNSVKATFQIPTVLNETPSEIPVTFAVGKQRKTVWGRTLTEVLDGTTTVNGHIALTWGQLNIVAWLGDAAETVFLLPADKPSLDTFTDTFKVYNLATGAAVAGTPADDQFTAGGAPAADVRLMGWYEMESSIF